MNKAKIILVLFLLTAAMFQCAHGATLAVSPPTQTVAAGNNFLVDVTLNTQGANVDGVDIRYINFNPALLQVIDNDTGAAGVQIKPGTLMPVTSVNSADNTLGRISFLQTASGGTNYTGLGTLATITFRAVSSGAAAVTFSYAVGNTTDCNVASGGSDVLNSVASGSYTLTDNVAPSVSITAPNNGATIRDIVYLNATAADNIGVLGVQFKIDGTNFNAEDTTAPYSIMVNTRALTNATHTFAAVARDAAGNTNTSTITVNVSNNDVTPPAISGVTSSAITPSSVTITWLTDEPSDSQINYGTMQTYGLSTALDSAQVTSHSQGISGLISNTLYHFRVKSRDPSGNIANSLDYNFTTASPDTTKPTVSITSPSNGATVINNITITATASDNRAMAGVQFMADGSNIGAEDTSSPYSYTLDTKTLANGTHTLSAVARDMSGNTAIASLNVTVANSYSVSSSNNIKISLEGAGSAAISGILFVYSSQSQSILKNISFTTNSIGEYVASLTGVTQMADLKVKVPGFLIKSVKNVDLIGTSTTIIFPPLPAGDLDGNNQVNSLDYSYMNGVYYTADSLADLNKDGIVNALDFSLLNKNWATDGD